MSAGPRPSGPPPSGPTWYGHSRDTRSAVLVVHPGALGDLVQAVPAFAALRAAVGAAELAILVGATHRGFVSDLELFDRVLPFDDSAAYHGGPLRRLAVLARTAHQAWGVRPAACAVFKAAPVYAALALASGARVRSGLTRGGYTARALTHAVPLTAHAHWEDRYAALAAATLAALGVEQDGSASAPADARHAAERYWPGASSSSANRPGAGESDTVRIGIAPGGARNVKADLPQKRWPAERFAEVARRLAAGRPGARVVLLGARTDRAEADAVRRALPEMPVDDEVGRTTVVGAQSTIARLSVFLTNDSALLHVAATTTTPTVAVFGPTDPRAICPRAASVRAAWRPAGPLPCYDDLTGVTQPCVTPCCIERVDVEAVYAEAARALGGPTPPR